MTLNSSELYDAIYSFKDYETEAKMIRSYIENKKNDARTILDVACGTGQHAQYLNKHFAVDGMDLDEAQIELARMKNPGSEFWVRDMTKFNLNKKYDVITCLFSSIGFAGTLEKVEQTVQQFKAHLNENGIVLIEPWFTPDTWSDGFVTSVNYESEEYKISRMSHSGTDGRTSILTFEYMIGTKNGIERLTEKLEMGLFDAEELSQVFRNCGFDVEYDPVGLIGRGMYILSNNISLNREY